MKFIYIMLVVSLLPNILLAENLPWLNQDSTDSFTQDSKEPLNIDEVGAIPTNLILRITYDDGQIDPLKSVPFEVMDTVVAYLDKSSTNRIEIQAYAAQGESGKATARRISLQRALALRKLLLSKAIDKKRIVVKALGSKTAAPKDKVDILSLI